MSKLLYLECASGISGDMTVGALLDLGADEQVLRQALASLPVEGYEIAIRRVNKAGLDACDFSVLLDEAHENHDHDMAYLHGHHGGEEHDHSDPDHFHGAHGDHEHPHGEHAGHDHPHDQNHPHHHEHRGMGDILPILEAGALTPGAKALAVRIFTILAEAEAKAHGVPVEQVHFHEVGAVDSIVDIAAVAVCMDNLGITETVVPTLNEGTGFVRCQHGTLPVPVPATLNVAAAAGLHLHILPVEGELVTPTGAAIAAALKTRDALPERFRVERVGLGAGKRSYAIPSLLRAMVITEEE
jgi:hypothetical protein